ncbi:MAG: hypothetical protein Q8O09_01170 [Bacillota bacterium]|nr:hypothetical protein [Bacillota bacterium]
MKRAAVIIMCILFVFSFSACKSAMVATPSSSASPGIQASGDSTPAPTDGKDVEALFEEIQYLLADEELGDTSLEEPVESGIDGDINDIMDEYTEPYSIPVD